MPKVTFQKITFIIILVFSASIHCLGQTYKETDFKEIKPPDHGSEDWYILNRSTLDFAVKNNNGTLAIEAAQDANKVEYAMPNGKLVGTDRAQLGGKLTFVPDDKSKTPVEIKKGNIKYIFMMRDTIYFVEGPSKFYKTKGAINKLIIKGESFQPVKVLDLLDDPEVCTLHNDTIFIASQENFYIVHNFKKELLYKDTFWSGLYPNSLAVIDPSNIYVGMKGGYVKLDLVKKTMKLYEYKIADAKKLF